jgi:L-iditol 2-dehydrogenase
MKVGRLGPSGTVVLEERPEPVAGPGEVTVRLAACGVCGTDLEKLRGNYRTAGILGHEPAGRIAAVGEGVRTLAVGDRVAVHHHIPCLACEVCRRGDPTFCPTYSTTNLDPGGFAEVFRASAEHVRQGAVLRLAPDLDWDAGALLEPAGCALTALRKVPSVDGSSVLVLGLGPVGQLYARLSKALGASWVGGTEISELRRRTAERGGIDATADARSEEEVREMVQRGTEGKGVDLAVVAGGPPAVVATAFERVRRGGTINLFGLPAAGSRLEVDLQQLYLKGVRVVPSYATTEREIREVHELVAQRRLSLAGLVSHRCPLPEIGEAFRLASRPEGSVKVLVTGDAYRGE